MHVGNLIKLMRNLLLLSSVKVGRPIMPEMTDNVYPDKEIYASLSKIRRDSVAKREMNFF